MQENVASHRNAISHRQSIKHLYKQESLNAITEACLFHPFSREGDLAFSSFQRDVFHDIFPGFTYQYCVTSTISTTQILDPVSLKSICLDLPDEILESYMEVAQYDRLSPVVYSNPGRAISSSQIHPHEQREMHPFFHRHGNKYGIERSISVGYNYPGHHTTFIAFDYLSGGDNKDWAYFDFTRLELASFPFVLAWFVRRGMIDMRELKNRFNLLADLTEHQLGNLRKFINSPDESYELQSQSLGIKQATLKESLYKIRDQVTPRFSDADPAEGQRVSRSILRPLEHQYSFLKLLGDQTKPLIGLKEARQQAKLDCAEHPPQ